MSHTEDTTKQILAMERAALDRWGKGDPDGYLAITADDVSYVDPFLDHRLDGIEALRNWYAAFRGKVQIDRDAVIAPRVQVEGDTAVLTMQYQSHGNMGSALWNCTEVYAKRGTDWRIIHTTWSAVKPPLPGPSAS